MFDGLLLLYSSSSFCFFTSPLSCPRVAPTHLLIIGFCRWNPSLCVPFYVRYQNASLVIIRGFNMFVWSSVGSTTSTIMPLLAMSIVLFANAFLKWGMDFPLLSVDHILNWLELFMGLITLSISFECLVFPLVSVVHILHWLQLFMVVITLYISFEWC